MNQREKRIRVSDEELEQIKKAKRREGAEELPHAAYLMKVIEARERRLSFL